jgi:hypothetical protein
MVTAHIPARSSATTGNVPYLQAPVAERPVVLPPVQKGTRRWIIRSFCIVQHACENAAANWPNWTPRFSGSDREFLEMLRTSRETIARSHQLLRDIDERGRKYAV